MMSVRAVGLDENNSVLAGYAGGLPSSPGGSSAGGPRPGTQVNINHR